MRDIICPCRSLDNEIDVSRSVVVLLFAEHLVNDARQDTTPQQTMSLRCFVIAKMMINSGHTGLLLFYNNKQLEML